MTTLDKLQAQLVDLNAKYDDMVFSSTQEDLAFCDKIADKEVEILNLAITDILKSNFNLFEEDIENGKILEQTVIAVCLAASKELGFDVLEYFDLVKSELDFCLAKGGI